MRPGGGHAKGAAFERKMARILSVWWYKKPGYLWRRPGPGTAFFKKDKHRHSGDIVPSVDRRLPSPFPFHVELKCFSKKRLKLDKLLWLNQSPIKKMWEKVMRECRKDLTPMLLVKANLTPIVCIMNPYDLTELMSNPPTTQVVYRELNIVAFPWAELHDSRVKGKVVK